MKVIVGNQEHAIAPEDALPSRRCRAARNAKHLATLTAASSGFWVPRGDQIGTRMLKMDITFKDIYIYNILMF